ncbi:MAG TPA: histidine ammonia-lyase [Anaerolineae bacterium]|nr:histidine ammonia-lyase [Anaerolineae bacterium]
MTPSKPVILDGHQLTLSQIESVARHAADVILDSEASKRVQNCSDSVQDIIHSDKIVYGVNTGFGIFSDQVIHPKHAVQLSRNLILSHATGLGPPFPMDVVRTAMLVRANTFAQGHSGVRPEIIATLIQMLSKDVVPKVPSQGSLGSSGDLAPLSHLALVLSSDPDENHSEPSGEAWFQGTLMSGAEAMRKAGIPRICLQAKEGLAITNGATFTVAMLALACLDARSLLRVADIAAALSIEALLGVSSAFDHRLHRVRPHPGQVRVAESILALLAGSTLVDSTDHVQDAYSLRCTPQVHGPAWEMLEFAERVASLEINSATDNPLFFNGHAISGGNFHGEPIGLSCDYLKIALSEIGAISERRIFRLTSAHLNRGLPSMLVPNVDLVGLQSGLMMLHYTSASLALENQSLSIPDSVRSLSTSGGQEDINANATTAARHLLALIHNLRRILAIELIAASQAIDIRLQQMPDAHLGVGSQAAYRTIRERLPFIAEDHYLSPDIQTIEDLINDKLLIHAVDEALS